MSRFSAVKIINTLYLFESTVQYVTEMLLYLSHSILLTLHIYALLNV